MPTEATRRFAMDQALANTRIEGHIPTPEFLADFERNIRGEISDDEMHVASLLRAYALEAASKAAGRK